MRIAVTGATGFVGGAVARAAAARGWEVVGLGRRAGTRRWDLTAGPLADPPAVDAVVHCAAAVSDWAPDAAVRPATVAGTRYVAATFPSVRLVHVSSASVYDPFTPQRMVTEEAGPADRFTTAYARAKADAERALAGRPLTTVLRPHAVYGPGDRTLLPRVAQAVRRGRLLLPGGGAMTSLTHVDNLVSACLAACEPGAPDGIYNVSDAAPVPMATALAEFFAERGERVSITALPAVLARPAAGLLEGAFRLARRPQPPPLTRYTLGQLLAERTLDIGKARRHLGFDPAPTSMRGAREW